MKRTTLTERQLKAVYAVFRGSLMLGSRMPIAEQREPLWRKGGVIDEVTDESYLTGEELHDLNRRLADLLFPYENVEHEVEVEVAG
jgi:hypothetical protein